MRVVVALALILVAASSLGFGQAGDAGAFRYVHRPDGGFIEMIELERLSASEAVEARDAERWGLTLSLLLEFAAGADEGPPRAYALDAALALLVSPDAWRLIDSLSDTRRAALLKSLSRFDRDDPAGLRPYTDQLAKRRIAVIEREVIEGEGSFEALDSLLAAHGWTARGAAGPSGRQRSKDRPEYRTIDRHDVFALDGLTRRHLLLPPTEALEGMPQAELERKLQRTRNFARRISDLWTHQDGPRVHDFILDAGMRDATGLIRLVHADTQLLAQHDRMRRWRLREAVWRLGG
ncbi:MAG: hypothetical protein ACIAQU_08255 [Phycisphaerales bacterium JB064]